MTAEELDTADAARGNDPVNWRWVVVNGPGWNAGRALRTYVVTGVSSGLTGSHKSTLWRGQLNANLVIAEPKDEDAALELSVDFFFATGEAARWKEATYRLILLCPKTGGGSAPDQVFEGYGTVQFDSKHIRRPVLCDAEPPSEYHPKA